MYKRHDLLIISDKGRSFAFDQALKKNKDIPEERLYEMIFTKKIPAIVKRQSGYTEGLVEIGYSSWYIINGRRLRAESAVPVRFVKEVITPFQLVERGCFAQDTKIGTVLRIADESRVKVGIFGSVALGAITGLPYVSGSSDLDIVIEARRNEDIKTFYTRISQEPALETVKLDIELDVGNGYSVKLKEFFSDQATIMAKGLWDVKLFDLAHIKTKFSWSSGDITTKNAVKALLYEMAITPKPGLVDLNNNGAHTDMDFFKFIDSVTTLIPHFRRFYDTGNSGNNLSDIFEKIRYLGILAEEDMLASTRGINTHKGAIFALGIICAAIGYLYATEGLFAIEKVLEIIAGMSGFAIEKEFDTIRNGPAKSFGEKLYIENGIKGARGEAASGFLTVKDIGLPVLRAEIEKGRSINDAAVITLLNFIVATDDTNLIKRGGMERQDEIRDKVEETLCDIAYSVDAVLSLDKYFISENLSPGGSADLLAATLMLYFMDNEETQNKQETIQSGYY